MRPPSAHLLALDYKLYEIIVVDDGSTDETAQVMKDAFHMWSVDRPIQRRIPCQPEEKIYETRAWKVPITLVRKKNGGKADALNMGINVSNYPYFLCIDADSVLQHDSLEKIVRPVLEDPDVVAVGGAVRPCNGAEIENGRVVRYRMPRKLLACMQVLEYDRSFLASRILFDKFNGNIIISGAFGLFLKSVVIAAGGYDNTSMGEDMELVVKLHVFCRESGRRYRIRYATDAICWTQVPERLGDLCRQRRRWHIGLFQSMMKHRNIMANPKYGAVSFISYLYFLLYELFSPYIEVFGLLTTLLAFAVDLINVPFMLLFFGIYVAYSAIFSLTAFWARIHTIDLRLYPTDLLKAVGPVCHRGILPAVYSGLGADDCSHRLSEKEGYLGSDPTPGNQIQINGGQFMKLEEMKQGLWGYKKDHVFLYIATQEEAFSQKLLEKDAQMERMDQQAQTRIRELEEENSRLREEVSRIRGQYDQISTAILDARASAEALKAETQVQEEAARQTLRQALEQDLSLLDGYRANIKKLRESICATLEELNAQTHQLEQQAASLSEAAPTGNLALFR